MAKKKSIKKKSRSPKQKANDKKIGRMAKSRARSTTTRRKTKKTTKVKTMVKRKRRKSTKSNNSGMLGKVMPLLAPIAYGFIREKASTALSKIPFIAKLPVTNFTDEAVMLGAIWGAKKLGLGKKGIGASALRAAKTVELARVGQTFADITIKKNDDNTAW